VLLHAGDKVTQTLGFGTGSLREHVGSGGT
jgi:hypothetical protein